MGAYAYCYGCKQPITAPTLKDCLVGFSPCPNCEEERAIDDFEKECAVDELLNKLNKLEEKVKILESKLAEIEEN